MATINSMQSTFDTTLTFYFTPEVGRVVLTKNGVPFKVLKPGDVFSVTAKNLRAAREFVDKKCLPVNCLLVSEMMHGSKCKHKFVAPGSLAYIKPNLLKSDLSCRRLLNQIKKEANEKRRNDESIPS